MRDLIIKTGKENMDITLIHGLYRQFGFKDLAHPSCVMEIYQPEAHLLYQNLP
ncbi:hypothetical protein [Flavihumibacter fluvii]|uniref:hypothetical protein n=1 Tax=Flavihumibacter fluvii TaxID=2838157 RepID=UPI001BDEA19E|nr:hypothetical protein [Flavihumibacter fluvii]ULQ51919.1 hypothetical protein KJS93_17660 [Flavihumibacter fluvii]